MDLDRADRRILAALQEDASVSIADLAEEVGLSQTPCWRRVKRLEEQGYIRRRVALLDREKLELATTVFVALRTNRHNEAWALSLVEAVSAIPEIVEFYRMSGDTDYLMKVVCRDIVDYDRIYKRLILAVDLTDVSSSFAMEQIKSTTAIPVLRIT